MLRAKIDTDNVSRQIGVFFAKFGLSANGWTVVSLILAIAGFVEAYLHNLTPCFILFVFSCLIDTVDGAVAKATQTATNKGAFFDGIIDRYVELLIYFSILVYGAPRLILPASGWIALAIAGSLMTSYTLAYADHKKVITDSKALKSMGGLLERLERTLLIGFGVLCAILFGEIWLTYMLIATAVLSNFTALQRITFVLRYEQ